MTKVALALGMMVTALLVVGAIASFDSEDASAGAGGMTAMSIDAVIAGNDATTLGTRDECVEVSAGDDVEIDVTALEIPETSAMIAFNYEITYNADFLSVVAADHALLLSAAAASGGPIVAGDVIPDTDGLYLGSAADTSTDLEGSAESGSGVLSRLTIAVDASTPPGGYPLILDPEASAHIDTLSEAFPAQSLNDAQLAVDVTCDSLPPPSTPFPFAKGDNDCDNDVDSVDALVDLQFVAGFNPNQQPGCPAIGSDFNSVFGDIDCNDLVNAVDALKLLQNNVGFDPNLPDGCGAIEEPF